MAYDVIERSNSDGAPINLYEFCLGENLWRYASSEEDVTAPGYVFSGGVRSVTNVTYKGVPVSDSGLVQSGDVSNEDFTVTLPATAEFLSLFIATPPSQTVFLVCRRKHRGDSEAPIKWVGEVRSTKRISQIETQVICKVITSTLNRNGLRLAWGRGCPHALYDRNCGVNPLSFGVAVQVQSKSGISLVSSAIGALPYEYFAGGYVEFSPMAGVKERRPIESHYGSTIVLMGTTDGIEVSDWLMVFPGCNRTSSTCTNKFNNLSNYGGYPHMPGKSPFDGDPVF